MRRIVLLTLGALIVSACQPSSNTAATDRENSKQRDEQIATLINLHGMLCARVIFVGPEVAPGEVQVNCDEYRDAAKSKTKNNIVTYMVNLNSNSVRLVGRG
jgi:hypothetical protein